MTLRAGERAVIKRCAILAEDQDSQDPPDPLQLTFTSVPVNPATSSGLCSIRHMYKPCTYTHAGKIFVHLKLK